MKSPFHMLFGPGLKKIFCDHAGKHEEWGYKFGSGICELYCSKCGKVIQKVPLDDLPKDTLQKLIRLLDEEQVEDQDSEPGSEE
jgi:hypothetical protein